MTMNSDPQKYLAEIRGKDGRLLFQGQPYETREEAARYVFRHGSANAKDCSTSRAYRKPDGNWGSMGSDIRWHKRRDILPDVPAPCDHGLFSSDPSQVDLEDLLR
jgi:hypothetical protein